MAWNLRGLGFDPLLLTAIGKDSNGDEVCRRMDQWGLDSCGVQLNAERPTGQVLVSFDNGEPDYEIAPDQAYDHYEFSRDRGSLQPSLASAAVLYHGSLCWRNPTCRTSIQQVRDAVSVPRFIDLNIRRPWFETDWLEELLSGVTWLKLNAVELAELTGLTVPATIDQAWVVGAVNELRRSHRVPNALVTAGSTGAFAVDDRSDCWFAPAAAAGELVDTVGAGDAFSSMAIAGLMRGWTLARVIRASVEFAARACTIRGATTEERSHYRRTDTASPAETQEPS